MQANDPRKASHGVPGVQPPPPLEFCGHRRSESHRVMLSQPLRANLAGSEIAVRTPAAPVITAADCAPVVWSAHGKRGSTLSRGGSSEGLRRSCLVQEATVKKVLIIVGSIVGGLAVLVALIIGVVVWSTGGAVEATDQFLALIAQDKIDEAYQSTATGFRSQQDAASFGATVKSIGLTRYASASWANRQIQNDRATLEGSVTTADGGTIPLTIELVSEGDAWKVLSLTAPMAGAAIADGGNRKPAVPDDDAVRQLVNQTMRSFAQSLERNDFAPFYATISERWKGQVTGDGLSRAFQPLVDQKTTFGNIQTLDPTFGTPPALDQDGLLKASGAYATEPHRARFELTYIYEAPAWKLFGIRVVPESAGAPSAEQASPAAPSGTTAPAGNAYAVVENAELTGRLGRVIVVFPEGSSASSTRIVIRPEGGTENSASNYGGITADLLPGKYDVIISGVVIPGAEVRSRHDTKFAVGVLRVSAGDSTRIQIFRGQESVASGYGKGQYGLPAGSYEVEISGKREPITITAGAITDF
jgi:hypothetical protein